MSDIPADANAECVGPESESAGKASSCAGCPNQESCASGAARQPDPALEQVKERLADIKHTILVLSGKGGVGKSSIASQLSWTLASSGYDIGILDIDICGPSIPRMMGVEQEEVRRSNYGWSPVYASDNLAVMSVGFMLSSRNDAIIWRGPRKNGLIKQFLTEVYWGNLDFLIIDSPPGTSDEHISIAQYLKPALNDNNTSIGSSSVDGALIITTPQEVSLLDVRKEINFCKKTGIPIIGVIENMSGYVCPCCGHHSEIFPAAGSANNTNNNDLSGAEQMCVDMGVPFIGKIPLDPQLLRCCERGIAYIPQHETAAAAQALRQCIITILNSSERLRETSLEHEIIGGITGIDKQQEDKIIQENTMRKEPLRDEQKDKEAAML